MIRAGHLLVAGLSGFSILVLEFGAVRMLAPAFGQSNYVWANVIGLVLLALALGYAAGGRLGERSTSGRPLYFRYGIAAAWIAGAGAFGPDLCALLVPTGLPTEGGLPLGFTGSLVAALLLFGPPSYVLAMTSPFLIRLDAREGREGRTTGGLYAVGTLGSLAGCFMAPLWMLQVLGTRQTLYVTAGIVAGLSLVGCTLARKGAAQVLEASPGRAAAPATGVRPLWILAALVTGWAVTAIEFGAVRFMSPWFGQSNHIWANVIGLILLALACGSWIGGRWADAVLRHGAVGERSFVGALAVAALSVGCVAWVGPAVLERLMPAGIDSLRLLPIANQGSRVAALLFFGLPMVLLGTAPPFLVRLASPVGHAGRTAGTLFSWTTVGGLVGCFTTAPLLVPALGSRGTLLLAALAVGSLGLWLLQRSQAAGPARVTRGLAWLGLLLPAGLLLHQIVVRPPLRVHAGQVVEIESAYQTIRVVRERLAMGAPNALDVLVPARIPYGQEADTMFLRHDEDAETYQSVFVRDDAERAAWLTGGRYFEHMAIGAFFARKWAERPLRVLIIGYAGGTVHRTLRQTWGGDLDVLGVEIDPAVIDVANRHLGHVDLQRKRAGHDGDRLRLVTNEDARTVVNALPAEELFDLVLVDAYTRTNYVPFQLASVEFFERVRAHLAEDGWIGVNVLGHGFRGPVARAVASTMGSVYGGCWAAPNPAYPGNVILWTQPAARGGPRIQRGRTMHPGMHIAAFAIERYLVRHDPATDGGVVLTDDKSPSDRLADSELGL